MSNLSAHFNSKEFECPCCKKVKVDSKLVDKLEAIRKKIGDLPIIITSGYRCQKYNASIGGYSKSPHLKGNAVDCKVNNLSSVDFALKAEVIKDIRIGLYPSHLHLDIIQPNPSKYWIVKKYGQVPIYSRLEMNLKKFLKNNGVL